MIKTTKKTTKKKVVKKKTTTTRAVSKPFALSFRIGDNFNHITFKGKGKTIKEAIEDVAKQVPKASCSTKGIFIFTYKKHKPIEKFMVARQIRKLFGNEMNRIFYSKTIMTGFGFNLDGKLIK